MSYFRELPDVLYQSPLDHKISSLEYVRIKNIFRRVKIRDWIKDNVNFFNKYTITEGERPDIVAEKMYGSSKYDWIVVLTSGITNIKDEWPLSNRDLNSYVEGKYGLQGMNEIHHHETKEVIDKNGRLILPAGQKVDADFRLAAPSDAERGNKYIIVGAYDNKDYTGTDVFDPTIGITNYEYETRRNEEKRQIDVMKPIYLQQFLNDMRTLMAYDESSLTLNPGLIGTQLNRLIGP